MENNHGDLFGEAEQSQSCCIMERGSCHRSPSAEGEIMVAAAGFRIILLIIHTVPIVGSNKYLFNGRRSKKIGFPTAHILFYIRLFEVSSIGIPT